MSCESDGQVPDYKPPPTELDFGKASYHRVANHYPGVDYVILPVVSFNRRGSE